MVRIFMKCRYWILLMRSILRFVSTGLLSPGVQDHVKKQEVGFADAADAASAVLKIASDPTINGGLH